MTTAINLWIFRHYEELIKFPSSIKILMSQFLCPLLLGAAHVDARGIEARPSLYEVLCKPRQVLPIARHSSIAFISGFVQTIVVLLVESANILVILAAPSWNLWICASVIEVVLNFIAIAIIADFDDIVFNVLKAPQSPSKFFKISQR